MVFHSSRGRPLNAPAAFIRPCLPTVAQEPPRGHGWLHELKHDGYRLQIHVRDGRVRLFTMNAPTGQALSAHCRGSCVSHWLSIPKSSVSMLKALLISMLCTAGQPMRKRWP